MTARPPACAPLVPALLILLVVTVLALVAPALIDAAGAQTPEPPLTTGSSVPERRGEPPIIPQPNSGHAPEDPGDRGGWQQLAVLGVMLGGIGLIAGLVVRDGRRKRSRAA